MQNQMENRIEHEMGTGAYNRSFLNKGTPIYNPKMVPAILGNPHIGVR